MRCLLTPSLSRDYVGAPPDVKKAFDKQSRF